MHDLRVLLGLNTRWHRVPPLVTVRLANRKYWHGNLDQNLQILMVNKLEAGTYSLEVELHNKTDQDSLLEQGLDMAAIINSATFNDLSDPKFLYQARYWPQYPDHMLKENPSPCLNACNYLGWNGVWRLEFTMPIFTWIHQVRNLGWIYY